MVMLLLLENQLQKKSCAQNQNDALCALVVKRSSHPLGLWRIRYLRVSSYRKMSRDQGRAGHQWTKRMGRVEKTVLRKGTQRAAAMAVS
eukprot:27990_5